MKAKIIRGTTLRGEPLNEGDIVELDETTFNLFRSNGQAVKYVPDDVEESENADAGDADPKKAPRKAKTATPPQS